MKEYQIKRIAAAHGAPRWDGTAVAMPPIEQAVPKNAEFVWIADQLSAGRDGNEMFTLSLWERGDWTTHHIYRRIGDEGFGLVATRIRKRRAELFGDLICNLTKQYVTVDAEIIDEDAGCVTYVGHAPARVMAIAE